jgi:hypothetical protein
MAIVSGRRGLIVVSVAGLADALIVLVDRPYPIPEATLLLWALALPGPPRAAVLTARNGDLPRLRPAGNR